MVAQAYRRHRTFARVALSLSRPEHGSCMMCTACRRRVPKVSLASSNLAAALRDIRVTSSQGDTRLLDRFAIRSLELRDDPRAQSRFEAPVGGTRAENYNWKRIQIISFVLAALLRATSYDVTSYLKTAGLPRPCGVNGRVGAIRDHREIAFVFHRRVSRAYDLFKLSLTPVADSCSPARAGDARQLINLLARRARMAEIIDADEEREQRGNVCINRSACNITIRHDNFSDIRILHPAK